jgi:hypothetical protein
MEAKFNSKYPKGTCIRMTGIGSRSKKNKAEMILKFAEMGRNVSGSRCPFYPKEGIECQWYKVNEGLFTYNFSRNYFLWFQNAIAFLESSKTLYEKMYSDLIEWKKDRQNTAITDLVEENPVLYARYKIYLLTMGYAFENLLKTMLTIGLKKDEQFNEDWYDHNLIELAKYAGLTDVLSVEINERILGVLSSSIVWTAKYPAPRNESEIWYVFRNGSFLPRVYAPQVVELIEKLFWEIFEKIPEPQKRELKKVLDMKKTI